MYLEKIYERFEDFQLEVRESKTMELFYTVSYNHSDGVEERETLETDAKGVETVVGRYTVSGKRMVATLVFTACIRGEPPRHLVFQEQIANSVVCNPDEHKQLEATLAGKIEDMVKGIGVLLPGCRLFRGAVTAKVG